MNVTIHPALLRGSITPPPSKSVAHRLLLAAALAEGESCIENVAFSQDILATISCLRALGASVRVEGDTVWVSRGETPQQLPHLDCGESGSTLRFMIPVALALCGGGVFTGRGKLMQRPQQPYFDLFDEKGIPYEKKESSLLIRGRLTAGEYALAGNVSSQFITGLLYALPLVEGESSIRLTTALESSGYIDMTLEALAQFGIAIAPGADGWKIRGGQQGKACSCRVEADASQAAFFWAAAGAGSDIAVCGLREGSRQGDRVAEEYCRRMHQPGEVFIDICQCPDLAPALAAQAALRAGQVTHLTNAARLRIKESDRLEAIAATLRALGAQVETGEDFLTFHGVKTLAGGQVDSFNDHRIAMMVAVAATRAAAPVTILGAQCVEKSYPDFWDDYESLGGILERSTQ